MASPNAIQLFSELGAQFDLDPKVTAWLTAPDGLAAKRLDDLLYACNEDGIDKLVEAAKPRISSSPPAGCARCGAR